MSRDLKSGDDSATHLELLLLPPFAPDSAKEWTKSESGSQN